MKIYIAQIRAREISFGHRHEFRRILGAFTDYQTARSVCMEELDAFMDNHGISPRLSSVQQFEDSFECSVDFDGYSCLCDFFATELKGKPRRNYDEVEEVIIGEEREEW